MFSRHLGVIHDAIEGSGRLKTIETAQDRGRETLASRIVDRGRATRRRTDGAPAVAGTEETEAEETDETGRWRETALSAYDSLLGKRESESITAEIFESEFTVVTGRSVQILSQGEAPDCIAAIDGIEMGLELTAIHADDAEEIVDDVHSRSRKKHKSKYTSRKDPRFPADFFCFSPHDKFGFWEQERKRRPYWAWICELLS